MIEPSENFTAEQIRLLQTKAAGFITFLNTKIVESASAGDQQLYVKTNNEVLDYDQTFGVIMPVKKVFESRGFEFTMNGQSGFTISWGEVK